MLGELVRRAGFWSIDFIRGSKIRKHYQDIKSINEKIDGFEDKRQAYLDSLLTHAVNNSRYYWNYKGFSNLEDFPVIDKNVLRNHENDILANNYRDERTHSMSTSGSTGTPLTVKQNVDKRLRVLAELIYFGEQCGYYVGERNAFFEFGQKKTEIADFRSSRKT